MIEIRPARTDDRAGIAAAHVASIRGLTQSHYSQEQIDAWSAGKKAESYPVGEHPMFVAVDGDEVVGFSELRIPGREVRAVYVAPKVAGKGVGRKLLDAVEAVALERGLRKLHLGSSLNAVGFYKNRGYAVTGQGTMSTSAGVAVPYQTMEKALMSSKTAKTAKSVRVRSASVADAAGIAKVHVGTWRTTYKGIVPDEHLASLSEEKRAAFWAKFLDKVPAREHMFVAVDDGDRVVGFCNGGTNRSTDYDYDGEILAIYLLQEWQGSGIGRRLMQASIDRLVEDGFKRMLVWVLADNPTCGFYERMGGKVVGEKMETIGDKSLKELAYGWGSLRATTEDKRIYHIVDRQAWEQARPTGEYRHRSLEKQGFIHCSNVNQVVGVANHCFRGQGGLVLLDISEARLLARVQYENLDGGDDLFPHIYGPLNCDAVVAVHPFEPKAEGMFALPATLSPIREPS